MHLLEMSNCYFKISLSGSVFHLYVILDLWEMHFCDSLLYHDLRNIWFFLANSLYFLGIMGFIFNTNNLLLILIRSEIIFLAVGLNFIGFSHYMADPKGQLYTLFLLVVVAAESILGLSLIFISYRLNSTNLRLTNYSLLSN